MAAFDFKKAYKDLYLPKETPELITVPVMRYIAVDGAGDPNEPEGAYSKALALLYALCYTIKMSKMGTFAVDGYYDYVVPPLEGFWQMDDGAPGVDYTRKSGFTWTSLIRQLEFVTPGVFAWACDEVRRKKGLDPTPARLIDIDEGLCVQCLHVGPFDDEPATVAKMERYMAENGLVPDFSNARRHHEIYLGDPRKCAPDKQRSVLRHPVKSA